MREVIDPFRGKKYSEILEGLSGDARKAYTQVPHPLISVPGTGAARWDGTIGRWVV